MNGLLPAAIATVLVLAAAARAAEPMQVGACVETRIATIGERLQSGPNGPPIPGSGSAISYTDGLSQVSYNEVPQVNHSRVGDPVRLCLIHVPRHCPPGDDRGRVYRARNLRTHDSWTLPDSEHSCGGA